MESSVIRSLDKLVKRLADSPLEKASKLLESFEFTETMTPEEYDYACHVFGYFKSNKESYERDETPFDYRGAKRVS